MIEEKPLPITTATIAHLYALQGKLSKAEAIYRQLLQEKPDDPRLVAGLSAVMSQTQVLEPDAYPSEDTLEIQIRDGQASCRWAVTEKGIARARLVLEGPGDLALRLIIFPQEKHPHPQDILLEQLSGELTLPQMANAGWMANSVGLLGAHGQFASITHRIINCVISSD